jgi:hypothetical protein
MTLVERLGALLQWLDSIGLAPPSRDIRIVEINSEDNCESLFYGVHFLEMEIQFSEYIWGYNWIPSR